MNERSWRSWRSWRYWFYFFLGNIYIALGYSVLRSEYFPGTSNWYGFLLGVVYGYAFLALYEREPKQEV